MARHSAHWSPTDFGETLRKRLSMFVLRAKVAVTDVTPRMRCSASAAPAPKTRSGRRSGDAPEPGHGAGRAIRRRWSACPTAAWSSSRLPRPARSCARRSPTCGRSAGRCLALARHPRRRADDRAGDAGPFRAADGQLGPAGRRELPERLLSGPGNRRAHAVPGRLKERMRLFHVDAPPTPPGTRIYGAVFGDQACGTVVNAAPAPAAGSDLLAVVTLDQRWTGGGPATARMPSASPDGRDAGRRCRIPCTRFRRPLPRR